MTALDIGEEFLHLANDRSPTGSAINTRRILEVATGSVMIAMDAAGHLQILVPVSSTLPEVEDNRSRALRLFSRDLQTTDGVTRFVGLECTDTGLALVFERVVADVVRRLVAGTRPDVVCTEALGEWRSMFDAATRGIARETAVGLIGELEVLARLGRANPESALESWWGPSGHVHDFYSSAGRAIEVKATTAVDGGSVHISNLDQLDTRGVSSLHLAVCALRPQADSPDLDDRIRAVLSLGFPRDELLGRIAEAGHVFEAPTGTNTRFDLRSFRVWKIDKGFPGLRRSQFSESDLHGVFNVKFELSLDSASQRLSDREVDLLMSTWTAHE